jgi:hypothetical protein
MFADFWYMHADVIRNAFVFFLWTVALVAVTALVTWRLVLQAAHRQASETLKQKNVELTIRCQELTAVKAEQWREIERLTRVQNGAIGMANTMKELVLEK